MTPERIRAQMIKCPHHRLWGKSIKEWTFFDKKVFLDLENPKLPLKVKKHTYIKKKRTKKLVDKVEDKFKKGTKVRRNSDGKIYTSITSCMEDNNFTYRLISDLLAVGIEFNILDNTRWVRAVIRIDDVKPYRSINLCIKDNKLSRYKLNELLKVGKIFKYA